MGVIYICRIHKCIHTYARIHHLYTPYTHIPIHTHLINMLHTHTIYTPTHICILTHIQKPQTHTYIIYAYHIHTYTYHTHMSNKHAHIDTMYSCHMPIHITEAYNRHTIYTHHRQCTHAYLCKHTRISSYIIYKSHSQHVHTSYTPHSHTC